MITMIQCHFEISGIRKDGGYDSGLNHGDIAIMCPLERVFFFENMCHTGTSNGGKKWRMVLFQVDSIINKL